MRQLPLLFAVLFSTSLLAQSNTDSLPAKTLTSPVKIDGLLNEPDWYAAGVQTFTQRELNYGAHATEKTKVVVLYDKNSLYIGVWCYTKDPGTIRAKFMQRDFDYTQDDNFQIALSPFNDQRNGYLFIVNPNGARADLLISGNEEANKDWSGVWDCKTSVTNEGWFAEIRIPFNTIQFRNATRQNWGINFERDMPAHNEQVLWKGWTRDCSIYCLGNAGTLTGIENIGYAKRFELKPYGLAGFEKTTAGAVHNEKLGGDLNVNLTPTLKLNLTANTDFAQVEADRIAVNLSRFNLYYPEKREFFLEGYQNFQFALGNDNQVFYTRRIGIENFSSVPVVAGARLFGKIGVNNLGILNIQTGSAENILTTNNTVVRYKRDISDQSYIGAIFTNKVNGLTSNQVGGLDGSYSTSRFLGNKNLVVLGLFAQSFDKQLARTDNNAWRFYIDYPNDLIDNFVGLSSIGDNFNPSIGFLARKNFESLTWNFRIAPRWFQRLGIRRMYFRPWGFTVYRTKTTKELESFDNESRPIGFFTKSGERFEFNLIQKFDRVDIPFDIAPNFIIPAGKYWMYRKELQVGSFQGRRVWVDATYGWGGFYGGNINYIQGSLGININKHLNLRTDYTNNYLQVSAGSLTTNELAQYVNYAFTPNLDLSFFVQWNSLDDLLFGNFRLHWIPKLGSDLFVVYNRGYDHLNTFRLSEPQSSTGAAKLVWRFVF